MKFNGALVKTEERTVAIAVVSADFFTLPQEEKMALMRQYASAFPGVATILMTENENGQNAFFGRPDLVNLVSEIPLTYMTWKTFETQE